MVILPDPPSSLPDAPRAFYEGLRAALSTLRPTDIDAERAEIDFGDGGVAVTLPHVREEDWTLAAQVSRRAAIVFAGPATRHFDGAAGRNWTAPAVALLAEALRGDLAVDVAYRGGRIVRVGGERVWGTAALALWRPVRTEIVRMDFGGRAPGQRDG